MLTKGKVIFIASKALKCQSSKNEINIVIVSQTARLQHNRVNFPFLQKYIGKVMIFAVFKEIWHKPN